MPQNGTTKRLTLLLILPSLGPLYGRPGGIAELHSLRRTHGNWLVNKSGPSPALSQRFVRIPPATTAQTAATL